MSKQNTTKETLDQMVETNKNMEHNTAMENTYNLDTKQLMTNKKADLVAMNLQHKAEIEELRAMIADLKATATKPNEVDYRRMLKDEVVRATKKAEKATATKTTKKATKKSKKTATKSKAVVAEKPTKLTKEERKAISDSKIVHCAGCDAWCTGQGKQTVAEWQAKHIAKITRSVAKESKAKAKKILALHVFVNGPRS